MKKNENLRKNLKYAAKFFSQSQLASALNRTPRTIRKWLSDGGIPAEMELPIRQLLAAGKSRTDDQSHLFSFIDLFAGIGGIRRGFEAHGGKCIFTSEWDKYACQTYRANFPQDEHEIAGDITKVEITDIPDHDILLAGFPCQPFSIAGVSKKNSLGRKHGFEDKTQGTLFHDVARIIAVKKPRAFLLENVKNLLSHDKGNTWAVIKDVLENTLKYKVFFKVIDARHFVPQHRERLIIIGFSDPAVPFSWDDLRLPSLEIAPTVHNILHPEDGSEVAEEPFTIGKNGKVSQKYVLSDKLWRYLQDYADKHKKAGNGFGYGLIGSPHGTKVARTLSARYYKDGSEILVSRGRGKNPRRLTPRECARLMGFDSRTFRMKIPVSDTQSYKQFGNSVVVPVIQEVARIVVPHVVPFLNQNEDRSQLAMVI